MNPFLPLGADHPGESAVLRARRTGVIYPPGWSAQIQSATITTADLPVAEGLRVPIGAPVIQRQRVTSDGAGTRQAVSVSWFPAHHADTCPLLLDTARITEGTFAYIEARTGLVVAHATDVLVVKPANPYFAAELGDTGGHAGVDDGDSVGNRWR